MSEASIKVLTECLEAIEEGSLTIDECLDKYPEHRAELTELLLAATQVRALPTAYPSSTFRTGARARLLKKLPQRAVDLNGRADAVTQPVSRLTVAYQRIQPLQVRLLQALETAERRYSLPSRPIMAMGGLALVALLILFVSTWAIVGGNADKDAEFAQNDSNATVAETDGSNSGEEVASNETMDSGSNAGAAASAPAGTQLFIPIVSDPLQSNPQTAAVQAVDGVVEVQAPDGSWTAVNSVTTVAAGQRVRTGALSSAKIAFYDGSFATVGPNAELSIDQLSAQRPGQGPRSIVMTQWMGESEHNVQSRQDEGSVYEVKSPSGSGVARGTIFQVVVTTSQLAYYTVIEGHVDVTHLNVTVAVVAGQLTIVYPNQPPSQPAFTVSGNGEVTAIGESWTIGGQTFATTADTVIVGSPQIGDVVSVYGYLNPDGTKVATYIVVTHRAPENQFALTGEVTSIGASEWVVAGQTIAVSDGTAVDEEIVEGDTVRVFGLIMEDGTFQAERIDRVDDTEPFEFVGVVEVMGDSWVVSGVVVATDENTEIKGDIAVGDVVKVEGEILEDGTWLADEIKLDEEEPFFEFTGVVQGMNPWLVSGVSFTTDEFTEIDADIAEGDIVYVEGQILDDGTWLATEIRLVEDDESIIWFVGTIDSLDPWIVNGIVLTVDGSSVIDANLVEGMLVYVQAMVLPDGSLLVIVIDGFVDHDVIVGCFSTSALVVSINGTQLTLEGLPVITLSDSVVITGDLVPNSVILIHACGYPDGMIVILDIVVVYVIVVPPPPPVEQHPERVTICHKGKKTMTVPWPAWVGGHSGHGDWLGSC